MWTEQAVPSGHLRFGLHGESLLTAQKQSGGAARHLKHRKLHRRDWYATTPPKPTDGLALTLLAQEPRAGGGLLRVNFDRALLAFSEEVCPSWTRKRVGHVKHRVCIQRQLRWPLECTVRSVANFSCALLWGKHMICGI